MNKKDITTYSKKFISVTINKPALEVYNYASNPENWSEWMAFIQSVTKENDTWYAMSDWGRIKVEFVSENNFGIMDHWVTTSGGMKIYNPVRIIENGEGSEFIFTLFQLPHMTDKAFEKDEQDIVNDLKSLKKLLETAQ